MLFLSVRRLELDTEFFQVQPGNLLVQLLGQHVDSQREVVLAESQHVGAQGVDPLERPPDVQRLLHGPDGKPRVSILNIAHLSDGERMSFVTLLLGEVLAWARRQPGTGSLRALLYMDEVFGYLPPTREPPSKAPLLTLLKQARAHGLGLVLATQNPVDVDYKALSNCGTWMLGRLQTERDRAEARFDIAREAARAMIYDIHDAVAGLPGATPARALLVDQARDYLDRLSALSGDDPALQIDLAGAYLRVGNVEGRPVGDNLGRTADAQVRYRQGLALLGRLPRGLPDSLAAAAAHTEGQLWKGLGVIAASTATPDSALADLGRALTAYRRAVRLSPDAADYRVDLASAHINIGDYSGHPYFPNAGRPDSALAHYARARALLEAIPEAERSRLVAGVAGRLGVVRVGGAS